MGSPAPLCGGFWHSVWGPKKENTPGFGTQTAEDMAMCAVVGTCCALYAARVTIPRGHYAEATTRYTQSWDLLLRKGGERKAEWRME